MKPHEMKATGIVAAFATAALFFAPVTLAAPDAAARVKKPDPMQVVRGAKAWKNNCARCHNLRSPKELTDEEWDVSVDHMRVRANLSGAEAEDIKTFLKASNK